MYKGKGVFPGKRCLGKTPQIPVNPPLWGVFPRDIKFPTKRICIPKVQNIYFINKSPALGKGARPPVTSGNCRKSGND